MSNAPEWLWRLSAFVVIAAGIVAIGTSSIVSPHLANYRSHPLVTSVLVGLAGGTLIAVAVFLLALPYKTNTTTIEEKINFHSRSAQARSWQPPQLSPMEGNAPRLVTVKFGGLTQRWPVAAEDAAQPPAAVIIPGGEVFKPYTKDDRLYIRAQTILGQREETVMMSNEWPPTELPSGWDRNFNSNAFEIVDESSLPLLQIRYLAPDSVEIYGIFVAQNGAVTVAFGNSTVSVQPRMPIPNIPNRKAWFKYPSSQHLGDLATP